VCVCVCVCVYVCVNVWVTLYCQEADFMRYLMDRLRSEAIGNYVKSFEREKYLMSH
jgi:hypothetical protein